MFFRRLSALAVALFMTVGNSACAHQAEPSCKDIVYNAASFTVCKFSVQNSDIRLFLNDVTGKPYANFATLKANLATKNQTLNFAMNGGMYHDDRSAVGLYIEDGKQLKSLSTKKGPGNFHMMPNGVFYMSVNSAGVLETSAYLLAKTDSKYATQSGPMLVINGKLHPKFNKTSTSKHIRNGVGVRGDNVYFVISNEKVNFHTFASLFKDHLETPNALYLDGVVSKIYAPELNRQDIGRKMGPMIAVVGEAP